MKKEDICRGKIKNNPSLTDFEKKVLLATLKIPKGEVSTYSKIAKAIGNEKAARAVAGALKKNPYAPIVPCHRVIRTDESIGGYSAKGGIMRKKELLRKEGVNF